MSQVSDPSTVWTALDLVHRFGPIPLHRVVHDPAPGSATVADVVRLDNHDDRLCELIDGTLVEKTMGYYESFLAIRMGVLLSEYITRVNLGIVAGEGGMMQLSPEQVRIPDVSFISWDNLAGSGFPDNPVPHMVPTLAVEVISKSNTPQEMLRKLSEYFEAGTQLVWYIYPHQREVKVFTSPTEEKMFRESDTLSGGDLLPGFSVDLKTYFALPADGESHPE